ncbi:prepilin peptidase [Candidatus Daviesbacteria bacterium]|nr:prepilin peptidase [Candidatus Daviesbacteria bacterium]
MWLAGFLLGTVLGSFVKALADRSLYNRSFLGRSYCPKCKHILGWYDLFPIFSYILVKGKCRYCHKKIGIEYVVIEVVVGMLIALLFWQTFKNFQFSIFNFQLLILLLELITKIFFITILAVLFLTDLKKMFIPDRIVLPSIVIGIILGLITVIIKIGYLYFYLSQTALGKLLLPPNNEYFQRHALTIAEPFLWALLSGAGIALFFFSLIVITKGKGMGGGDVKLGGFMGVMLGFPSSLFAVVLAFFIGAVFSIGLILLGKKHFGQVIPFGPFLVIGSLIMLFWGQEIIDWYLRLGRI